MACLTCILQGVTICLQGTALNVKQFPLCIKSKTADVFLCLQIFFSLGGGVSHTVLHVNVGMFDNLRKAFYDDNYGRLTVAV